MKHSAPNKQPGDRTRLNGWQADRTDAAWQMRTPDRFKSHLGLLGIDEARSPMFDGYGIPRGVNFDEDAPIPLYHFVYCSRAAEGVDDAEVSRIVEAAQRNNLANGITGVLVFGSGSFFQWIEGPAAEIQKLIATLHSDKRHHDIVSLSQSEEERERLYSNWDMEEVEAEDIQLVLQDALESAEDKHNRMALTRILQQLDSGSLNPLVRR